MSLPHAASGEIINVQPYKERLPAAFSTAILRTDKLELIRTVLHAGKAVPEHCVEGELTIQCLEGRLTVTAHHRQQILTQGEMVFLAAGVPYALSAPEETSALLTILRAPVQAHQSEVRNK